MCFWKRGVKAFAAFREFDFGERCLMYLLFRLRYQDGRNPYNIFKLVAVATPDLVFFKGLIILFRLFSFSAFGQSASRKIRMSDIQVLENCILPGVINTILYFINCD